MVDMSKHLERAQQALDRRQYDAAIERCLQCQDVDPTNLELYRLLVQAAKKKTGESGSPNILTTMSMPVLSKDPHKIFSALCKKLAKNPDIKNLKAAGDAAMKLLEAGVRPMVDVAIILYEEGRSTGLFHAELLWGLGHAYHARFKAKKEKEDLTKAIASLYELEKGMPSHPEAGRTAKNWEAEMSMARRAEGGSAGDFRSQLASGDEARRNEVMNRIIRTMEDAKEVLTYLERDVVAKPNDKALWVKKGDVHRRVSQWSEARECYAKAQALDQHDFTITMRVGEVDLGELQQRLDVARKTGADSTDLQRAYLERQIKEYRMRCERQPTEMKHQYQLGTCLYQAHDIDGAAACFQRAVNDPRFKRFCHNYLGHCFLSKNLLDLAVQQYTSCLSLIEDDLSDEAKETRYHRARALESQGRRDDAIKDFTRLVELDLGFKDAAQRLQALRAS